MNQRIGILASGGLGFKTLSKLINEFKPQFIFTDKSSESVTALANSHHIPVYIGNPKKTEATHFLKPFQTDVIFSINYLFIVQENILNHPEMFAINFHGSLLPKYRGRTPHVWAIINGEKETGITAHLMEKSCDTGDIILQKRMPISINQTGADILKEFEQKYPEMVLEILQKINHNNLPKIKQDEKKASWFGKRTPEDGLINWSWQKERIYNWVRAQAYPYPGAFTFLNNKKIIIDEISYSDYGFSGDKSNGTIVKIVNKKPYIKTPNGVVILKKLREEEIIFQDKMLLG